ncbi:MAG: sigma 54-interacting transcriptional regulator, partial [Bacteroidales bacterium]|nr:sigma 54-interacting transcriptional regulator [Bacteroidales bacterium]
EVGELPLSTQARLLRVLESGEYIKVGSSKVQKTNVRIVAATNLDVQRAVAEGRFREDLYYRLNSANIHIPPLRERPEDVYMLFRKFAGDCADKYRMPPLELQDDARKMLEDYDWPGNIRQLKNIAEQISVIETNREITADTMKLYLPQNRIEKLPAIIKNKDQSRVFNNEREILYQVLFDMRQEINDMKKLLHGIMNGNITADFTAAVTHPADFRSDSFISAKQVPDSRLSNIPPIHIEHQVKPDIQDIDICEENVTLSLHDNEKEMIKKALLKHGGKRKNAAHDLKISERTLYRKIKEYELENN